MLSWTLMIVMSNHGRSVRGELCPVRCAYGSAVAGVGRLPLPEHHDVLRPEAGGNVFHSGGRQFGTKQDPDYKVLVQWVSGAKLAARPER